MRAHNVIIITTGASHHLNTKQLDDLIQKILGLKKNPILVLGPDGDEFLRSCNWIEQCDIVYDPNYAGQLFSGIKAGLHSTNGAAFVLPLSSSIPDDSIWSRLEMALLDHELSRSADVIRTVTNGNANSHAGYPFLVTRRGVQNLLKLDATTDWESAAEVTFKTVPSADLSFSAC